MANNGDDDAVSSYVIGCVVLGRQNVAVGQAHEPGCLSWRKEAGANAAAADDDDSLPAGSSLGSPQATCDPVEAHFGALCRFTSGISPRAAVERADDGASGCGCGRDLRKVLRGHHSEEMSCLLPGVPRDALGVGFDDVI